MQLYFFADHSPKEVATSAARVIWGGENAKAPFSAFWYFTALWFTGLFYRYLWDRKHRLLWPAVLLSLALTTSWGRYIAELPLSIGHGFSCLIFFAVAHQWRKLENRINFSIYLYLIVFIISTAVYLSKLVNPLILKSLDFGTPILSILISCILGISLINSSELFIKAIPEYIQKLITRFVGLATPIILLHPVPIWVWNNLGWTPKDDISKIILFIIAIVFSVSLGKLATLLLPRNLSSYFVPGVKRYISKH